MIRRFFSSAVCLAILLSASGAVAQEFAPPRPACTVRFSPHGGCQQEILARIGEAKKTIRVQAYSFTSQPIAASLIAAHRRGVDVKIIADRGQRTASGTQLDDCERAGIKCYVDAKHAIAHNKVIVIDGDIILTGSYNFTNAAEDSNAENLLTIRVAEIARKYTENWEQHRQHSEEYHAGASRPAPSAPDDIPYPYRPRRHRRGRKISDPRLPAKKRPGISPDGGNLADASHVGRGERSVRRVAARAGAMLWLLTEIGPKSKDKRIAGIVCDVALIKGRMSISQ